MMYIISVLPLVVLGELGYYHADVIGLTFLFIMAAGATGLLIYKSMTKPHYIKDVDEVVEDFVEWQNESKEHKNMRRAISTALWSLIFVIYFVVSFVTMWWHITWIVFIAGCGIEALIELFLSRVHNKRRKK